jgi:hypothetical protein
MTVHVFVVYLETANIDMIVLDNNEQLWDIFRRNF